MIEQNEADAVLQFAVIAALRADPRVRATEVGVDVRAGVVSLTGEVESWDVRTAAQNAAHRVEQVKDLANEIRVRAPGTPGATDAGVARCVRHALRWNSEVPEERIRCTVADGIVTLEGTVQLASERAAAERCIKELTGVREVQNRIEVDPSLATRSVSELAVRAAVQTALAVFADHEAKAIAVGTTEDGFVTLSGVVLCWEEKHAVEKAVRDMPGVRGVDSRLQIQA